MPSVGLEPTRPFGPQGLSLLRLPFHHKGIILLVSHLRFELRPLEGLNLLPLPVGLMGQRLVGLTGLEPASYQL